MTVYWAGTEKDAFVLANAASCTETTTAGKFDSTYSRCSMGMNVNTVTEYLTTPNWGSNLTELWLHFRHVIGGSYISGLIVLEFVNGSGTVVFKLTMASSTTCQASYWNGATYTNVGSAWTVSALGSEPFDIHLKCGASGVFECTENNSLVSSGTFSDTDCDNVASIRFHTWGGGNAAQASNYSECVVADVSTVGWHVWTRPPTGNGANTTWTGTFADVDETVLSDADFISGAANGDLETYTGAAATLTGLDVKAVVVSARVKRDTGGPQNLQMALRESSTNYPSATVTALTTSFASRQAVYNTDPNTGVDWTPTNAGAATLEFGVKAIT